MKFKHCILLSLIPVLSGCLMPPRPALSINPLVPEFPEGIWAIRTYHDFENYKDMGPRGWVIIDGLEYTEYTGKECITKRTGFFANPYYDSIVFKDEPLQNTVVVGSYDRDFLGIDFSRSSDEKSIAYVQYDFVALTGESDGDHLFDNIELCP